MIGLICDRELTLETMAAVLDHAGFAHAGLLLEEAADSSDVLDEAELIVVIVEQPVPELYDLYREWNARVGCPVLVVAHFTSEAEKIAQYEAGAADCIERPVHPALMLAKVQAWLRFSHKPAASDTQVQYGAFTLNMQTRDLTVGDASVRLTTNEARLLQLLLRHPTRVISSEQIHQHLRLRTDDRSTALKNIVYRLRRKLNRLNPTLKVLVWRENGYTFEE